MKKYQITCNEDQLRLLRSAVQLQMRVRIGQGWAITENVISFASNDYRDLKDYYDPILDRIMQIIAAKHVRNPSELREENARSRTIERDMWISLENALGLRKDSIPLGEYGFMKVEEVPDDNDGKNVHD